MNNEANDTVAQLNALGGVAGAPALFEVSYKGHKWHARKVDDTIYLARTCRGCWATGPGYAGMWSTRKHSEEDSVSLVDIAAYAARTARLRSYGEDEIASGRDANALRIL